MKLVSQSYWWSFRIHKQCFTGSSFYDYFEHVDLVTTMCGGHGSEHLGKQLSHLLALENILNVSRAAVTSRNDVPRLTLPFSMVYTCQLFPDTERGLIKSKHFLPLHAPPTQERKKKKKRRYVTSRFQRPLGKPLNHLIQTTPSVNFKVKTFHWDITFRFDISLLPWHTHQLAEKQGDSSKNEMESC